MINYYVLFALTQYQDVLVSLLNKEENLQAINPKYEYYRRDRKNIDVKSLFPGYVLVKTELNHKEFRDVLKNMEVKKGLVKELHYQENVSSLLDEEVQVLKMLLDDQGILRMSYGTLENRRIQIHEGPLVGFEHYVTKVDKHNRLLELDLYFLKNQKWEAGFILQDETKLDV